MIVGTAGHIDHGKTALVHALTGVDTDRLKEEKARGITIELGYAYLPLDNGDVLGFIDVPGHEKLVHTMAAGACGIDFALIAIAADDGVMPQSREHLAILQLLGITRGAIALTKIDRVECARVAQVRDEIRAWLAPTMLAGAPIFETQALKAGDAGVAALDAYLREAALAWRARRDDGLFRLPVDRVFTLAGTGTIVTGTAFGGQVSVGDTVWLAPRAEPVRVRSVHVQNRAARTGRAGERCALNLAGIPRERIARGDWIVDRRLAAASERLDVEMAILPDAEMTLDHWTPLHVHLATTHRVAHGTLLEGEALGAGQAARVQLVFDEPVCALPGDRFIVRNAQATRTVGGGRVLDPFGPAKKRRTPERRAWLDALTAWLETGRIEPLLERSPRGMLRSALEQLTGSALDDAALPAEALVVPLRGAHERDACIVLRAHWKAMRATIVDALRTFHERSPDEQGPDIARARRIAAPLVSDALWRELVEAMVTDGEIARSGPWLHLPSHSVSLDVSEERLAARLLPILAAGHYDSPWVRDLASALEVPEAQVRNVLRKLACKGDVYQVVRDLFYLRDTVCELARLIAQLAGEHGGGLPVASFRDATGLGRKRAIQLLEFFDRVGYTRFLHEVHVLRADSRLLEAF